MPKQYLHVATWGVTHVQELVLIFKIYFDFDICIFYTYCYILYLW